MKRILFAFAACFIFSLCAAQQGEPIIVEGRYSAGAQNPSAQKVLPQDVEAQLDAIQAQIDKANYTAARDAALKLLNNNIEDPRIYGALAFCYEKLEDFENAVYYSSQAIAKRPSDAEAFTVRGFAYYKKGDLLRAKEDIDTALKLNPKASLALSVKDMIAKTNAVSFAEQAKSKKSKNQNLPSWFVMYVICVISVVVLFMAFRYRGFFHSSSGGGASDKHLKEVNIKEQYHFIRMVGEGGMGKVYEAYDNVLKRKVAVKRIKPELLRSNYVREQFLSEARMVAMLHHPNIVEIYTVIETTNSLYLVFEYVDGQTLETRLDIDSYIPFDEAKELFGGVCKGLSYAHANNIVHCDLKPGNIMIADNGLAKVMDFGVAKKVVDGQQSDSRTVAGTPAYMSPEQQKGFMNKQSDIYSLGVCFYEALVGQVPWAVKGFDINTKKIVPPSEFSNTIPKEVDDLIERAIKENPSERIKSVDEFWNILKNIKVPGK